MNKDSLELNNGESLGHCCAWQELSAMYTYVFLILYILEVSACTSNEQEEEKKGGKRRKEDPAGQRNEGEMYQAQIPIKYEVSSSHPRHPGPDSDHL